MSLIFAGVGLTAFLACAAIAIDVGEFMTARAQAQNSADAGALAGATALAFDDYVDRSSSGPAVTSAIQAATTNQVIGKSVSVTSSDVTFLNDPNGLDDRVKVNVFRTNGRGNPVPTWIGGLFGITNVSVDATATAEASPGNAATCLKPWMIPDKWIENQTPPFDQTDTFTRYQKHGNAITTVPQPDVYVRPDPQGNGSGYRPKKPPYGDVGWEVMLKAGNPSLATAPSNYYAIDLEFPDEPNTGADRYRWNIDNCNQQVITYGDSMINEPGDMAGPTYQGLLDLIARDPNATWDDVHNKVVSNFHPSPRIINLGLFDPDAYDYGRASGKLVLNVVNIVGFFVEDVENNGSVLGRMVPAPGLRVSSGPPAPANSFMRVITLVQ